MYIIRFVVYFLYIFLQFNVIFFLISSKYLVKNTIAANIEGFTALCALIQVTYQNFVLLAVLSSKVIYL